MRLDWRWERERRVWVNDKSAMNRSTLPREMSMPPKSAPLINNREVVSVGIACSDWALRYVCGPICPPRSQLPHSMPEIKLYYFPVYSVLHLLKFTRCISTRHNLINNFSVYAHNYFYQMQGLKGHQLKFLMILYFFICKLLIIGGRYNN